MVFEVLGPNMQDYLDGYKRGIPMPQLKAIALQVLNALDRLHRTCHVIHTDIKLDNILMVIDDDTVTRMAMEAVDMRKKRGSARMPKYMVANFGESVREKVRRHRIAEQGEGREDLVDLTSLHQKFRDYTQRNQRSEATSISGNTPIVVKIADLGVSCWIVSGHVAIVQQTDV